MASSELEKLAKSSYFNGNGLLLYYHHASYYSQRVVMALNEKRLQYKASVLQLLKFEQYEPWFVRLNPKAQVPVLKDGVKIIPDSTRIIDYLEDNFSNGDVPRLWPERGSEQATKVEHFRELLDGLPIETVTYGCIRFEELTENMKLPVAFRKAILANNAERGEVLEAMSRKYPELSEHYERKRNRCWQQEGEKQDINNVRRALDEMEAVLDRVEQQLEKTGKDGPVWLLCSDKFTVADISLTVLLNRLVQLGLSSRFLHEGRRPHLTAYWKRVQTRESFRKTFVAPSTSIMNYGTLVDGVKRKGPVIASLGVLLATATLVAIFLFKSVRN